MSRWIDFAVARNGADARWVSMIVGVCLPAQHTSKRLTPSRPVTRRGGGKREERKNASHVMIYCRVKPGNKGGVIEKRGVSRVRELTTCDLTFGWGLASYARSGRVKGAQLTGSFMVCYICTRVCTYRNKLPHSVVNRILCRVHGEDHQHTHKHTQTHTRAPAQ